jgi:protein gp37
MAENSKIQWTTHTLNPWRGCVKVSPGCAHCYAESQSKRNPKVLGVWGANGTRVLAAEAQWREPGKWDRESARTGVRPRVFCASLADVFEDWPGGMTSAAGNGINVVTGIEGGMVTSRRPYELADARERLFQLIRGTPNLDWLLLTKRPQNIGKMMPGGDWPNVWLGTTVESPEYLWRLDSLVEAPQKVPVRFCSAEPLLAPLNLAHALGPNAINWVICGGESGGGARDFDIAWARSLRDQCRSRETPFFMKQLGVRVLGLPMAGDNMFVRPAHKGGDLDDIPADLRVREFPDAGGAG